MWHQIACVICLLCSHMMIQIVTQKITCSYWMTLRPFEISRIARLARALKDDGGVENMDVLGRYSLIGQLPYVLHSNIHSTFRGCNKNHTIQISFMILKLKKSDLQQNLMKLSMFPKIGISQIIESEILLRYNQQYDSPRGHKMMWLSNFWSGVGNEWIWLLKHRMKFSKNTQWNISMMWNCPDITLLNPLFVLCLFVKSNSLCPDFDMSVCQWVSQWPTELYRENKRIKWNILSYTEGIKNEESTLSQFFYSLRRWALTN